MAVVERSETGSGSLSLVSKRQQACLDTECSQTADDSVSPNPKAEMRYVHGLDITSYPHLVFVLSCFSVPF